MPERPPTHSADGLPAHEWFERGQALMTALSEARLQTMNSENALDKHRSRAPTLKLMNATVATVSLNGEVSIARPYDVKVTVDRDSAMRLAAWIIEVLSAPPVKALYDREQRRIVLEE